MSHGIKTKRFCKQRKKPRWMERSALSPACASAASAEAAAPPHLRVASPRPGGALREHVPPSVRGKLASPALPCPSVPSSVVIPRARTASETRNRFLLQPPFLGANNSNGSFTNFHFILRSGLIANSLLSSRTLSSSSSVENVMPGFHLLCHPRRIPCPRCFTAVIRDGLIFVVH